MNETIRKKILKTFPKEAKLPSGIKFNQTDNGLEMILSMSAIGKATENKQNLNMQNDAAAFEGWAVIIYSYYVKSLKDGNQKIILKVENELKSKKDLDFSRSQGHYHRFLYRTMRFSEQYQEWFYLDANLRGIIDIFRGYFENESFVNNYPSAKKSNSIDQFNGSVTTESDVERFFVCNDTEKERLLKKSGLKTENLFRQLPVGLFKGKKEAKNSLFTRGKSAIDLWAIDEEQIAIFEIKTRNKMVGIISELFFYSNYVNDVFVKNNSITFYKGYKPDSDIDIRGYNLLNQNNENKLIAAYFLTDDLHPLINEQVIDLLNDGKERKIKYGSIGYKFTLKAEIVD